MKNFVELKQSLAQTGMDAAGIAATCGLAMALVAAWILTAPLFFVSDRLMEMSGKWRHKKLAKGEL